jgi:hypothetical protein
VGGGFAGARPLDQTKPHDTFLAELKRALGLEVE